MAVTGIGSNYNAYDNAYSSQKNTTKKSESKETSKAESEKSSSSSRVSDYNSYLSKTYDCVKNGNVAIAGSYLQQCANNPEKARELEENLSLYKEICKKGYESAKQNAAQHGGKLVKYSQTWSIDSDGNVSAITHTTSIYENGTKSQKELRKEREERLQEKREQERIAKKKEEEKKMLERLEGMKEKVVRKDVEPLVEAPYKSIDVSI